jgi:hypothetical protein
MDEYDLLYDPLPDGLVDQDWLELPELDQDWLTLPEIDHDWLELPEIDRDWLDTPAIEHESPEHDLDDWGLER